MKRIKCIAVLLAVVLLQGCAAGQTQQPLPAGWSESWERVGTLLGVEPMADFALNEENDALAVNGIYYATWTAGESRQHTNEDGEAAKVYDAQIYVLIKKCNNEEDAKTEIGTWTAREKQNYTTGETDISVFADQEFVLTPLLKSDDENPYTHGAVAFGTRGDWAICIELLCAESYYDDPLPVLQVFLSGLHYSE